MLGIDVGLNVREELGDVLDLVEHDAISVLRQEPTRVATRGVSGVERLEVDVGAVAE
jgi:hypothetical protein